MTSEPVEDDLLNAEEFLGKPEASTPWPANPALNGNVYQFKDGHGDDMVAMLQDTFLNFGTDMERMRRANADLDKKARDLAAQLNALASTYNDLAEKHRNLREATRNERRAAMEREIVIPDGKEDLAGSMKQLFNKR